LKEEETGFGIHNDLVSRGFFMLFITSWNAAEILIFYDSQKIKSVSV